MTVAVRGERQIVDLVRLTAGDGGLIKGKVVTVRPCAGKGLTDRPGVLGGEHHPAHLTFVAVMLEDLLADQLAFTIAVGRQPNALGRPQRVADGLKLGRLVTAASRLGGVEAVGAQQGGAPPLPGGISGFGLDQIK